MTVVNNPELNEEPLNKKAGSNKKPVTEVFQQNATMKGFNVDDYIKEKDTQPQQYDTKNLKDTLAQIQDDKEKEKPVEDTSALDTARAMMLLWLIDKMVSSICGVISLTFNSSKYSVSKAERSELVEYAGPVAEKILDKFEPWLLLVVGLGALYGDKVGLAFKDRKENLAKGETAAPVKTPEPLKKVE